MRFELEMAGTPATVNVWPPPAVGGMNPPPGRVDEPDLIADADDANINTSMRIPSNPAERRSNIVPPENRFEQTTQKVSSLVRTPTTKPDLIDSCHFHHFWPGSTRTSG